MAKLKATFPIYQTAEGRGGDGRLDRLATAIAEVRAGARPSPRTVKLLSAGAPKIVQKVIEESAEVGIGAMQGDRRAVISESVDLFYNLLTLWSEMGIAPCEVWAEMDRREATLGMAEKLPKVAAEEIQAA